MPDETTHGTWIKYTDTGRIIRRTAYSPADAVKFRFDGFEEVPPLPPIPRPPVEPPTRPAKATPVKATTSALKSTPPPANPTNRSGATHNARSEHHQADQQGHPRP